jgi:2-oxoglutarate/2-oxoacid ferredoxin oxidoreductase subunit beta
MHDGSHLLLKKLDRDYDPVDRMAAIKMLHESTASGETITGVLYVDSKSPTLIDRLQLVDSPLATLPQSRLRPSKESLELIMEEMR